MSPVRWFQLIDLNLMPSPSTALRKYARSPARASSLSLRMTEEMEHMKNFSFWSPMISRIRWPWRSSRARSSSWDVVLRAESSPSRVCFVCMSTPSLISVTLAGSSLMETGMFRSLRIESAQPTSFSLRKST